MSSSAGLSDQGLPGHQADEWLSRYARSIERRPRERDLGSTMLTLLQATGGQVRPDLLQRVASQRPLALQTLEELEPVWGDVVIPALTTGRPSPEARAAFLRLIAHDHRDWVRPIGNAMAREFDHADGPELQAWLKKFDFGHGQAAGAAEDGLSYVQTAYDSGRLRELVDGLEKFGDHRQSSLSRGDYPRDVFELAAAFRGWHSTLVDLAEQGNPQAAT